MVGSRFGFPGIYNIILSLTKDEMLVKLLLEFLKLIKFFSLIKLDDLLSYLYKKNKSRTFMKLKLPFYIHKVGAGFPSPATDYIEDDVDLNTHLIKNAPATFIIRVQGKVYD